MDNEAKEPWKKQTGVKGTGVKVLAYNVKTVPVNNESIFAMEVSSGVICKGFAMEAISGVICKGFAMEASSGAICKGFAMEASSDVTNFSKSIERYRFIRFRLRRSPPSPTPPSAFFRQMVVRRSSERRRMIVG